MLTQRKISLTNNWQSNSAFSNSLNLTNVHSLNRQYLDEMKGFDDLYTPKSLCLYLVKAAIIPMNYVVNEFNTHAIESQNRSDDDLEEDFDWDESIKRNSKLFWPNLQRVVTVSVLRKYYEFLSLQYLSARMTDKLTKDVTRSIARKCERFPRLIACQKTLHTAFYGNLIFNVSCFTYDVGLHIFHELLEQFTAVRGASKSALLSVKSSLVFTIKKAIYYSVCLGSCALGHAVGTYFNLKYGGTLGAFTFELLGSVACTMLLDDQPAPASAPATTDIATFPGDAKYARH